MQKLIIVTLLLLIAAVVVVHPNPVQASVNHGLVISEVSPAPAVSTEEFIEIYNNSEENISLDSVYIEYYHPTSGSITEVNLSGKGVLPPHSYYWITHEGYQINTSTSNFSVNLINTGGGVRLIQKIGTVVSVLDQVGWGAASDINAQKIVEQNRVPAPTGGKTLQRKIGVDNFFVDTDNNAQDFVSQTPNLLAKQAYPSVIIPTTEQEPTDPEPTPSPEPEPTPTPETPPVAEPVSSSLPLLITEILPNPASPATDDEDEYIELYNPNDHDIQLSGYRLETGSTFSYKYTFSSGAIPALGYVVVYSKDSNLTLSNTSGAARLLDPSSAVISETAPYEGADDGSAWAYISGTWQWTLTPTPGGVNILRLPLIPAAKITSSVPKAKVTKAAAAAKPKAAAKTASAKGSTKGKSTTAANNQVEELAPPDALHPSVLVGVGMLALLYAAYEYRGDIRSYVLRFQRYRSLR